MAQDRADEVGEPGERKILLGFHPVSAQDLKPAGLNSRILQQACLANARITGHHQGGTVTGPDLGDQGIQPSALTLAPDQHAANLIRYQWPVY